MGLRIEFRREIIDQETRSAVYRLPEALYSVTAFVYGSLATRHGARLRVQKAQGDEKSLKDFAADFLQHSFDCRRRFHRFV